MKKENQGKHQGEMVGDQTANQTANPLKEGKKKNHQFSNTRISVLVVLFYYFSI
jgi:hypothetical protein